MESEGTILQCASNYMKENNLSLLSQLLEKVSTKLDSSRKVNHADILVKLGQKGFPNRDFQSETYIPGSISTDLSTCDVPRKSHHLFPGKSRNWVL